MPGGKPAGEPLVWMAEMIAVRSHSRRRPATWIAGICSAAGIVYCLLTFIQRPGALAAEPHPRSVLVIDQFETASAGSAAVLSSFRSALRNNSYPPISIYIENLDVGRFQGSRYADALQAYFREKYRDKPIGSLLAVGSAALDLVLRLRSQLWPEAPVIFTAVDSGIGEQLTLPARVTGTTLSARLSDSVAIARAIVPGLKRVAIVGDPPERQFIRRQILEQLATLAAELEVIDLTRLTMRELRQRVASLPSESAIVYVGLTRDAEDVAYTSYEALAELAQAANRPIVIAAESNLGTGAVGGIVASFTLIGREAAGLVRRILDGEDPDKIPVSNSNVMKPIFDWRQLQRWNVSEDRLPPGSEVRFREPTAWERHWAAILAISAIVLVQTALITWLLYEHRRRRRSEVASHELSGRLIHAQEEERSRLARELHDDVTQRLASLAIDAGREERNLSNPAIGNTMRTMREGLVRLSEDVHALSYRLHPSILEDLGLAEALKSECERFSRLCSVRLETNVQGVPDALPHDVALCVFRIAQEGLRNIARHAGATRAELRLRRLDGGLQLAISDDGAGFDATRVRTRMSLGHASMRQRVFFLGGSLDIDTAPGRGTMILAWVPLKGEGREPSARAAG
jgi:signal transduction histidine kinase